MIYNMEIIKSILFFNRFLLAMQKSTSGDDKPFIQDIFWGSINIKMLLLEVQLSIFALNAHSNVLLSVLVELNKVRLLEYAPHIQDSILIYDIGELDFLNHFKLDVHGTELTSLFLARNF